MRKKSKMRAAARPAKFAEGGTVRSRGRGISQGLRRRAPLYDNVEIPDQPVVVAPAAPSLISNNPVGGNRAAGRIPVGAIAAPAAGDIRDAAIAAAATGGVGGDLPVPPEWQAPPPRAGLPRSRARRREVTADDLNDREMTRLLNERSLAAAQAGRNRYAKGGLVGSKAPPFGKSKDKPATKSEGMKPPGKFSGKAPPFAKKKGAK